MFYLFTIRWGRLMRKYLVGLSFVALALAAGCQSATPRYTGACPIRAQDAGFCRGPSGYGIALDPSFPG